MTERRVALLQRAGSFANPCLARRLARAGHDLVLHAPREGMVEELLDLGAGVEVVGEDAVPLDGPESDTTPEGARALVERALARFGRLDAAALLPPRGKESEVGSIRGRLLDAPVEHIDAMGNYLEVT